MKAKNRVIAMLVAVFVAVAMMPFAVMEVSANTEVNMFKGVICMGKTVSHTMSSDIESGYFHFMNDQYSDEEVSVSGKTFSWHFTSDLEALGESGYFLIKCKDGKTYESEPITIKYDITGSDFSDNISDHYLKDLTYTGKALKQKSFEIDLGPIYFTQKDFTITYKNNVNVGKATMILKGKGDLVGSTTLTFNIRPKGTTAKAPKKGKKSFTARWARQKTKMKKYRITGYQVQYSTTKNFSSDVKNVYVKGYKKTSRKIKGLAKKKVYYVHVRTYMKVGGKYYYSTWSKTKAVKTK